MSAMLTPAQVADRLGVSENTLRNWRKDGTGPRAVFLSVRTIRYPEDDLVAWLDENSTDHDE